MTNKLPGKGHLHCLDCRHLKVQFDKEGDVTGMTVCEFWNNTLRFPYSAPCSNIAAHALMERALEKRQ